jgi:hypothetical protein
MKIVLLLSLLLAGTCMANYEATTSYSFWQIVDISERYYNVSLGSWANMTTHMGYMNANKCLNNTSKIFNFTRRFYYFSHTSSSYWYNIVKYSLILTRDFLMFLIEEIDYCPGMKNVFDVFGRLVSNLINSPATFEQQFAKNLAYNGIDAYRDIGEFINQYTWGYYYTAGTYLGQIFYMLVMQGA